MTADHWFKPKTHGYGAYPVNWKGWALIAGFVAVEVLLALALVYFILPLRGDGALNLLLFLVWAAALMLVTWGFIRLSRAKTDGDWHWRWGEGKGG